MSLHKKYVYLFYFMYVNFNHIHISLSLFLFVEICMKTILLNFPHEHLIAISGTTRTMEEDIESICLYTNRKIYGPFGSFKGKRFRFYTENGSIAGFHGRVGKLFSALGVCTKSYPYEKDDVETIKVHNVIIFNTNLFIK